MAVLSLTWKSPYVDKTVFILRRGPDPDAGFELLVIGTPFPRFNDKNNLNICWI